VLKLIGLHSQHQKLLVVDLNLDYMHARNVEHRIGPGAPRPHLEWDTVGAFD
jgi:hypothetical protein